MYIDPKYLEAKGGDLTTGPIAAAVQISETKIPEALVGPSGIGINITGSSDNLSQ